MNLKKSRWFIAGYLLLFLIFVVQITANASPMIQFNGNTHEIAQKIIIGRYIDEYNRSLSGAQKDLITREILTRAAETHFDPLLIASIIAAESSFIPSAVSPCRARGLMQITSDVATIARISDPFDIRQNIYAGTRYLKYLSRIFSHHDLLLAAYNAGPTRVARLGRIPRIPETINYVAKIFRQYSFLQTKFNMAISSLYIQPDLYASIMNGTARIASLQTIANIQPGYYLSVIDQCAGNRFNWFSNPA
jgi:soluble lytic murein transglycosylase-like protein